MFEPLYNPKTIEEEIRKLTISQEQKTRANEWLKLINDGTLENEETNYIRFQNILLRDILNFPEKEIEKGFEKKDVEYSFTDDEKTFVCIEAKGTKTKNLFARQARIKKDQETPVIQTITNMSRFPSEYGICTNYNNFILITKEHGQQKCHKFSFNEIKNNDDRLKEFILIFSYDNLKKRSANIDELHDKSVTQNEKFTEEFYDVFHETRLMLIKAFEEKQGVDRKSAIKYSQIILNRLLFIFFTSDKTNISVPKDLFTNQITKLLKSGICSDNSQHIYNEIVQNLFGSFGKGSTSLGIFGFNGGLFAEKIPPEIYFYDLKNPDFFKDVRSKSIKITVNSKIQQILDTYNGRVSPIIVNFLIMDAYDFEKEVDVRILGHVLEQSVSDIEDLQSSTISRRKKEGIFYTPEFITDYICNETILPYLSEKNSITIHQLVTEYSENLNDLENKFKSIKIIDPACGSGAFLIKAVEILLEIYHAMQEEKKLQGGYTAKAKRKKRSPTQKLATLDEQIDESRMKEIIENNIFGVDLSEESVGITKLSLFLKLSSTDQKLSDLSKNIKVGNSIIDDKSIDSRAFNWNQEFNDIFQNGGFDILVGNPPYVRIQTLEKNQVNYFNTKYKSPTGNYDMYILFIEAGFNLLKEKGVLGFITPHKFFKTMNGKNIRKLITDKKSIDLIVDFGTNQIFKDATTYTCILKLVNKKNEKFRYKHFKLGDEFMNLSSLDYIIHDAEILHEDKWNFSSKEVRKILAKIDLQKNNFTTITKKIFKGSSTGNDKIFLFDLIKKNKNTSLVFSSQINEQIEIENELLHPFLSGEDIRRYLPLKSSQVLLFPYVVNGNSIELISISILKKNFPKTFDYFNHEYVKEENGKLEKSTVKKELLKRKSVKLSDNDFYKYSAPRSLSEYRQSKIMIPDMLVKIRVNYDNEKIYYHGSNIHSVVFKDEFAKQNPYFYLGILNSTVFWFFITNTSTAIQGDAYRLQPAYLEDFCFPEINSDNRKLYDKLVNQVELMFEFYNEHSKKDELFWNRVYHEFKINTINKKLEDFVNLTFNEFLKEIQKISNAKLSLSEQEEWDKYFEKTRSVITDLNDSINKSDKEINSIVYDLYNISKDEIMIIEKS